MYLHKFTVREIIFVVSRLSNFGCFILACLVSVSEGGDKIIDIPIPVVGGRKYTLVTEVEVD
jgi:hypothetical protein